MEENIFKIKNVITINVDGSAKIQKNILRTKKVIFGILSHILVKMASIIDNSVIPRDEILD